MSIAVPSDWDGNAMTLRTVWSSAATAGNVQLVTVFGARAVGEVVTGVSFCSSPPFNVAAHATPGALSAFDTTVCGLSAGDEVLVIQFRRVGNQSTDTLLGDFDLHAMSLNYTAA